MSETDENVSSATSKSNPDETEKVTKAEDKPEEKEETFESTELAKFWKAVRDNPGDFTGWTYLLQYVEQEDKVDPAREAFEAFLARYPYCYGYWKKYADLEKKHGKLDKAEQVFEKGVTAIPLSVELWIHYIGFTEEKYGARDPEQYPTVMRRLYERAIVAAGTDFRSDKLWDMYIAWEKERDLRYVTVIYDKLLHIPTQLYNQHFENFKEHVNSNLPKTILSLDEFLKLRQEVVAQSGAGNEETPSAEDPADGPPGIEQPPGEDQPPGVDDPPGTSKVKADNLSTDAETIAIKKKVIEAREGAHTVTVEQVSQRWSYEEGIRRPYFHVKPLERSQLRNWKDYLDFEMENGTHERVMVLFERCMVACALYEDMWLKYAQYMESHNVNAARHVFTRACSIHLPKKPNIHLAWAAFEERHGNMTKAASILSDLEKQLPGLAMLCLRRISLERRQGNFTGAEELYKKYMDEAKTTDIRNFFAIKYARYMWKVLGNQERAQQVLEEALKKDSDNHKLLLQLIDIEFQQSVVNETRMLKLFDRAIKSKLAIEHRVAFSQRKLEFVEDFGAHVVRMLEVYDEHQKLVKEMQTSKKKSTQSKSDQTNSKDEGGPPAAKKQRTDSSSTNGTSEMNSGAAHSVAQHQMPPVDPSQSYGGWHGYSGHYGYMQGPYPPYGSQYYGQ